MCYLLVWYFRSSKHSFHSCLSTRLVFLVSGGPGRPPLAGRSVAMGLRNKLRKQKNDFLIFKARRVDTISKYALRTHVRVSYSSALDWSKWFPLLLQSAS